MLTLTREGTRVEVDPDFGARLTALEVAGRQLLLPRQAGDPPEVGGCYAMVPWAGRVDRGRFRVGDRQVQLELDAPPHALHGLAYRRAWSVEAVTPQAATLRIDLSTPQMVAAGWPFGGQVVQHITALPDGVALRLKVTADAGQGLPLVMGWHPWFHRHLDGVRGQASVSAEAMLERGGDGLPTGRLAPVHPGPWDDCMIGISGIPAVTWPGIGRVEVTSDLDHLVVFSGHPHGLCVEPQSGPPNAFNHEPRVLPPGASAAAEATLRWVPGDG